MVWLTMVDHPPPFGKTKSRRWASIWSGTGRVWPGLVKLAWGALRLLLAGWVWGTAIRLAHFQPPVKMGGVILALVGLLLIIWGLWGLWQALLILGLKRVVVAFILIYSLIVIVNVLTIPDPRPLPSRILTQLYVAGPQAGAGLARFVAQGPEEFLFAYTGRRSPPALPPGFPTPDPDATPIQAFVVSGGEALPPTPIPIRQPEPTVGLEPTTPATPTEQPVVLELTVGGYARVVDTEGQPLRARAGPGTSFDVVTRFPEGSRLLILEGPESEGGFTWWQVRGEQGEGWCADQWLAPTE